VLIVLLLLTSLGLPLRAGARAAPADAPAERRIPSRFWLYAGFAVLYGICETMNGNWSQVDTTTELGASATVASLALTIFWTMVTLGRVIFASIQKWFPTHRAHRVLPWVLAATFLVIASLPEGSSAAGVVAFGVAGLGCSALLPLTISFAQEELVTIAARTAGLVIAAYQVGYGLAAFGTGPLLELGLTLPAVFGIASVAAVLMGLLSAIIARPEHAGAALHPRPA
jgi:predicted MFS family arabinose efflux permease